MPNTILHDAAPTLAVIINGDDTTPTLKNLLNNGQKLGSEINNAASLNQYGLFELQVRGTSAFTAGGYLELYFILAADGTNYSDGDDSVVPPNGALAGIFSVQSVASQQRLTLWGLVLPPVKFKPLIINKTGQNLTNTDDQNVLRFGAYNDEVQ